MARRRKAVKRTVVADPRYNSTLITSLINKVMNRGKRSTAAGIVYNALEVIEAKTGKPALEVFENAIENIKPKLEVKSRRVGGATYQVPMEVSQDRQVALAYRWMIGFASGRKGVPMKDALANELMDAYKGQGASVKKRDDMHKMAQANKAFAHYRW